METTYIISIVSVLVSLVLGELSKKSSFIKNQYIPMQNLIVGFIMLFIDYLLTKDFHTALIVSGLTAGGTYDLIKNLNMFLKKGESE